QLLGSAAVRGEPCGDAAAVPEGPAAAAAVSLSQRFVRRQAHVPRGHRRAGEGGRPRGDQLPPPHGDHPSVSADHGAGLGALKDSGHLHRAEAAPGRAGPELRVLHRGEVLRRDQRAVQDGGWPGEG
ncbi:unnamed protein product, partial [Effrenium voratum]